MPDKIQELNKHLKDVKDKFETLRKSGIDEEILEVYLQSKTKLSRKDVKKLLNHQDEFYNKIIKKDILDKLEDKK